MLVLYDLFIVMTSDRLDRTRAEAENVNKKSVCVIHHEFLSKKSFDSLWLLAQLLEEDIEYHARTVTT